MCTALVVFWLFRYILSSCLIHLSPTATKNVSLLRRCPTMFTSGGGGCYSSVPVSYTATKNVSLSRLFPTMFTSGSSVPVSYTHCYKKILSPISPSYLLYMYLFVVTLWSFVFCLGFFQPNHLPKKSRLSHGEQCQSIGSLSLNITLNTLTFITDRPFGYNNLIA